MKQLTGAAAPCAHLCYCERAANRAEIERLRETLDRYRYVYHWWASDSYDCGGEFNARMNWARGEDVEQDLTPDQFAKIGHRFLDSTGRVRAHEQSASTEMCPRCHDNPVDKALLGTRKEGHVCGKCWQDDREYAGRHT